MQHKLSFHERSILGHFSGLFLMDHFTFKPTTLAKDMTGKDIVAFGITKIIQIKALPSWCECSTFLQDSEIVYSSTAIVPNFLVTNN